MKRKIDITKWIIHEKNLPEGFHGIRVVHISDLHNKMFGTNQKTLIQVVKDLQPDYIFITGDLIDRNRTNLKKALLFIEGIRYVAPIYYVTGNHEWQNRVAGKVLLEELKKLGVQVLHDEKKFLYSKGYRLQIIGMDDPYMLEGKESRKYNRAASKAFLKRFLSVIKDSGKEYTILLSHRPEFIHFYQKAKINLVFSGHAHGGQIRVPGIGGLLAPHQGFFPKYAEGMVKEGNTKMLVSRGLGNSCFPFRINNPPELVIVELKKKGKDNIL